ncbi:hypothetical protein HN958_01045 [Candidatus Falkowbacteria bacterium]|nr:hypothetical protein [Candidatus Falkowbacteria bacterium]
MFFRKNKNKFKTVIYCMIALVFFCSSFQAQAADDIEPLKNVYIKYKRTGWQTYDFYALTNLNDNSSLGYEWTINNTDSFTSPNLKYFLSQGNHTIRLRIEDQYGNTKYDNIKLSVSFWSLQNNWFWWFVYLFVVLIMLYYWVAKLIYLFNKRKLSDHTRHFFAFLDEHGWVEKVISHHVKK